VYLPAHFEEAREEVIAELIGQHPLGALVTLGTNGLTANHIPFLIDARAEGRRALIGHVARNNTVWQDPGDGADALVIFQGTSAYISPNWYPSKQATHRVVPTYNYAVVHVHGPLIVRDDPKWLRGVVGKLTKRFEASQPQPWKMADAPSEYVAEQLANIIGIEIPIQRMTGKWKVSQNRTPADSAGVVAALSASPEPSNRAMAELVASQLAGER
jgi:transcriptional regulator